jgi:hypothetical protein
MARPPRPIRTPRAPGIQVGIPFAKIGAGGFDLSDSYHFALTVSWPVFVLSLFILYGLITSSFAVLYVLQPGAISNARPGSLFDALFFSIETLGSGLIARRAR